MPNRIASSSKHHPLYHRRISVKVPFGVQRFLAAFEGFEGGFAIGASILVALSFAQLDRAVLLATVIITIVVNGFNNASVKYSSEHFLDEIDGRERQSAFREYLIPSLIEFGSYLAISFVSIVPLILIDNIQIAVWVSVIVTLVILYLAGYWRAYVLRMPLHRDAVETVMLGSGIILVGLLSGYVIHILQVGG